MNFQNFFNNVFVVGILFGLGYLIYMAIQKKKVSIDFHFLKAILGKISKK